jgi:uncharacterized protein (TIGR02270 family)
VNGAAAPPRAAYLADIFHEHLEELAFLWERWRAALRDPRYTLAGVAALEERIRARLQGAQVPGAPTWPRLAELVHGPDADLAFSAACVLLRCGAPAGAETVLAAFAAAGDGVLPALARAMAHAPLPPAVLARVRALLSARPARRGAAAAEVLAFHGALDLTPDGLRYFLEDEDAGTRAAGWRLAALAGTAPPPGSFARAMRDEAAPSVTHAALEAGAWCRVPGVVAVLRQLADAQGPGGVDILHLLAVLGAPGDAPRIRALVAAPARGPGRFRLAGAYGHPGLMDLVLAGMEDPDAATAGAAGAAFTRITGVEALSGARVALRPAHGRPPDEFEAAFLEEVTLPDAARARDAWEAMRPDVEHVPRLCRGRDVTHAPDAEGLACLDMESRWELLLRQRFHHGGDVTARRLDVFPQAGGPPA